MFQLIVYLALNRNYAEKKKIYNSNKEQMKIEMNIFPINNFIPWKSVY